LPGIPELTPTSRAGHDSGRSQPDAIEEEPPIVTRATAAPVKQPTDHHQAARAVLDSAEFQGLVSRRWRLSLLLTLALFVVYYGFILLVAVNKPLLATRVGETTTLGILLGVGVILLSWVLTACYVAWANARYDRECDRLRARLRH
jgi:uncharacterized membrane protein (DUF485 family)